ncbi:IniB N-terminal domain-containing protein [Saccharopolyspora phatthalungensis]|uniref:Uncharacterized protein n=1 Tax=Saccharopolyspora phatthalungensis TaxID=664693 RepID=A0A840Q6M5_9PSEU|nr:IniB N-terminal domain-containing protein [Saccharopolyspora phatthalungensis]MBB5154055.1 hypothetical protein [Saccharopolyspora phatthalungensis]
MVNSQHATGRAESPTSDPGTHSATGPSGEPTLYEFLTRLVSDPAARSAFDADPQATLDQAGLGGMSATDVLQATSLVLDYAPVEVVTEYDRSLQSSVENFAASSQHVAINQLHPAHPLEQEEQSMLKNPVPASFGKDSDVDAHLPAPAPAPYPPKGGDVNVNVEHNETDSHNFVSVHDVVSDNNIANGIANGNIIGNVVNVGDIASTAGDVTYGGVTQVNQTAGDFVGVAAGALVNSDANHLVGDVASGDALGIVNNAPLIGKVNVTDVAQNVASGDVTSIVAHAPVVNDVAAGDAARTAGATPTVGDVNVGDVTGVAGDVVHGDVTGIAGNVIDHTDVLAKVSDVTGVDGDVTGIAGNVPVAGVAGGIAGDDISHDLAVNHVTSHLPVDHVTSHHAASHLPVGGDAVEHVAGDATSALPLDGML